MSQFIGASSLKCMCTVVAPRSEVTASMPFFVSQNHTLTPHNNIHQKSTPWPVGLQSHSHAAKVTGNTIDMNIQGSSNATVGQTMVPCFVDQNLEDRRKLPPFAKSAMQCCPPHFHSWVGEGGGGKSTFGWMKWSHSRLGSMFLLNPFATTAIPSSD